MEAKEVKIKLVNVKHEDHKQVYATGISSTATPLDIRLDFFTEIPDYSSIGEKGQFTVVERVYLVQIVLSPLAAKQTADVLKKMVDTYEQKQREMKEGKKPEEGMYG